MPYIDKSYYDDDYKGEPIEDVVEFERLAKRASDQVDFMTNYVLAGQKLERVAQFLQEQIKKATASIVEYYALNGGYEAVMGSNLDNVSIGSFSYKEQSNDDDGAMNVAYKYLIPTGLLYSGVETW